MRTATVIVSNNGAGSNWTVQEKDSVTAYTSRTHAISVAVRAAISGEALLSIQSPGLRASELDFRGCVAPAEVDVTTTPAKVSLRDITLFLIAPPVAAVA